MRVKNIPRHTIQHIWKAYAKKTLNDHPEYWVKRRLNMPFYIYKLNQYNETVEVMTYALFRSICEQFLDRAKMAIINGEAVNIPHCGRICAKRIQRDFRSKNKAIDWGKTNEAGYDMVEGKRKYKKVYLHTTDEYCRIGWFKPFNIPNISIYEFKPTEPGASNRSGGFNKEFSDALMAHVALKYRYLFCPLRDYVVEEDEQFEIEQS